MTDTLQKDFLLTSYSVFSSRAMQICHQRVLLNRFFFLTLSVILVLLLYVSSLSIHFFSYKFLALCFIPLAGMVISFLWFKDIEDSRQLTKSCYKNLHKIERQIQSLSGCNEKVLNLSFFEDESKRLQARKYFMIASEKDYLLKLIKSDYLLSVIFEIIYLLFFFNAFKTYIEIEGYSAFIVLVLITICSLITLFYCIIVKSVVLEIFEKEEKAQ